jgi:hypothetical protein
MKKVIFTAVLLALSLCVNAQSKVSRDAEGNFYSASKAKSEPKKTQYFYTDSKGNKYEVYESANGAFFIIRTSSKTGKQYKQYLK